jgi:DNA-binding HxlR family transcriptional regulator
VRRTRFTDWPCSIARVVDLLGDWWTPLVLRECFYGVRRFDDFQRRLGIGRNILTERLKRLVAEGLLTKVRYEERPPRYEYRLTDSGRAFFDVLMAMKAWGDAHLVGDEGVPQVLVDARTHQPVEPIVVDARTGDRLDPRDLYLLPGPGYPRDQLDRAGRGEEIVPAPPPFRMTNGSGYGSAAGSG